jgi:outer membrane lipoprotein-sorting protein
MAAERTARPVRPPSAAGLSRRRSCAAGVLGLLSALTPQLSAAQAGRSEPAPADRKPATPKSPAGSPAQQPKAATPGASAAAQPKAPVDGKPGPAPQAAPTASAASQAPADVGVLLDTFARMPGLEARFVEHKQISLLAKPLESRGRLYFARPGLLLRRVEAPSPSEIVITPAQLRSKDANGEQAIDLSARADLRPFVESLVWLLSGNRKALAEVYSFAFEPTGGPAWRLTLTPKAGAIGKLIQHIRVSGSGLAVDQVEVREVSGDQTVTRIVEANPSRQFSADELKRLFGYAARSGGKP